MQKSSGFNYNTVTMARFFSCNLFGFWLLFHCCTAKPTGEHNHVTMSGEPTHFQVDDKAAELEINANAMGVKVNAKPASLQVVSKPGMPSIPAARPAVVVPQLPPPYLPAPFYPPPMIVGHRRTVRRRHNFFDTDPSMGNWSFKKNAVPAKKIPDRHTVSKKSEISSKKTSTHEKRQWIQHTPLLAQLVSYPPVTNIRVHPLVEQMVATSQGYTRQSIPNIPSITSQQGLPQIYSISQTIPYVSRSPSFQENGVLRNAIHRALYLPSLPGNQRMFATATMMPLVHQSLSYSNPISPVGPLSGYNGYYDPLISRDFVPGFGTQAMSDIQVATPRAYVPEGIPSEITYPSFTPFGQWQRISKRLTIPQLPGKKRSRTRKALQHAKAKPQDNITRNKRPIEKARRKRFAEDTKENRGNFSGRQKNTSKEDAESEDVAKRQFILTQPVVPKAQQLVAYVPVVTSPQVQAPLMQTLSEPLGMRRNLVLNLPSKTPGTFILNMPSRNSGANLFSPSLPGPVLRAFYKPTIVSGLLLNQQASRYVTGVPKSGIVMQAPVESTGVPLGELAGVQGTPVLQHNQHLTTLYNNNDIPSQVQDQIFGGSSLEGRATIPGRQQLRRLRDRYINRLNEMDSLDTNLQDVGDELRSYDDKSTSDLLTDRVENEGSFTQRVLPDGRTVLTKDHVGIGPITVEARTAEAASRDQDKATDMDLDSDKRKHIPRPSSLGRSYLDKRLGIPKPDDK